MSKNTTTSNSQVSLPEEDAKGVSRRDMLKIGFGTGAACLAGTTLGVGALLPQEAVAEIVGPQSAGNRKKSAFDIRQRAAHLEYSGSIPNQLCNDDEVLFPDDCRSSFHKTFTHNDLGEVDKRDFQLFKEALDRGSSRLLEQLPLDPLSERTLANPMGAFTFELVGVDSHATYMAPAPSFAGKTVAAEMGELYWQAITRDVPFQDYESDVQIAAAVNDLNSFSETVGPKISGQVTPETIFRGFSRGNLTGPYISQFLLQDIKYGPSLIEQRYRNPVFSEDFMTSYDEWLLIQKGQKPQFETQFQPERGYINNNRALAEYVHSDVLFQAYFNAALNVASYGQEALDGNNPYLGSQNQSGFVSFGVPEMIHNVCLAGRVALTGAWYHKWLVHRRLRPETFAGRIHNQMTGRKDYGIDAEIFNSNAMDFMHTAFGTYLLPQCYPEGSPVHPAYPAGHAVVAGACCTVLKAWIHEDYIIPNPVEASRDGSTLESLGGLELRLGDEVNKLANNISIGRNAAGVHYRSDGDDGLLLGEDIAIGILRDYSFTHKEKFDGFQLTKFDGTSILIIKGTVRVVT